jgi:hypothetical protein
MIGVFASFDTLVGIMAFSSLFAIFAVENAALSSRLFSYESAQLSYVAESSKLESALTVIRNTSANLSDAEMTLNYYIGPGEYEVLPFPPASNSTAKIGRLAVIGNTVYYITVKSNETQRTV